MTDSAAQSVTANQIVASNIAHYRKAAGLTQAELGARLGISAANLSAAERSCNGRRPRNFDAGELLALSLALGVPIPALLMPPPRVSTISVPSGAEVQAGELFRAALSVPSDDGTPQRMAYIERFVDLEAEHAPLSPEGDADPLDDAATRQRLTVRLDRIRGQQGTLRGLLDDLDQAEASVATHLRDAGGSQL